MKHAMVAALLAVILAAPAAAQKKKPMKTNIDSTSYAIGADLGSRIKGDSLPVNLDLLIAGLRDGLVGRSALTSDQVSMVLSTYQKELTERQDAIYAATADRQRTAGKDYLAQNSRRPGVTTLPSGLQYEVIHEGTGPTPTPADKVQVHYTGMLIDGKVFDSSEQRGKPITFGLGDVIRGWTEGLQQMKEGGEYRLFIPSDLAYGPQGRGELIPPNSVLIFTVKLLKVNP